MLSLNFISPLTTHCVCFSCHKVLSNHRPIWSNSQVSKQGKMLNSTTCSVDPTFQSERRHKLTRVKDAREITYEEDGYWVVATSFSGSLSWINFLQVSKLIEGFQLEQTYGRVPSLRANYTSAPLNQMHCKLWEINYKKPYLAIKVKC